MAHIDDARPVDGGDLSPAPGTPQSGTKAIVGAVVTTLLALLTALVAFVTGDETLRDVTTGEWLTVVISALASGGITGGAVYAVRNHVKVAA